MNIKKSMLLIAPLFASALLVGCGNRGGGVVSDKGLIKTPVEIVFKSTAGQQNQVALNRMIESFKEIEPNVTVTFDQVQGSYQDIADNTITGFTTGDYGDIVMVYPDAVADFIDYGFAFNLDPYINNEEYGLSTEDKEDLISTFMDEGRNYILEGTYSLPFSKSTELVYYNRERVWGLELEGVNNGNPINDEYLNSLTWEEFFGVLCPAIMDYIKTPEGADLLNTSGNDYAVMSYDSDDNLFITLAAQYGYDYTGISNGKGQALFNNDNMKNLMKEWNGYAKKRYITSAGASGGIRSNTLFTQNKILFSVGSSAGSSYQYSDGTDVGVFKIPHAEGHDPKVILQGPSVSILRHRTSDGTWDTNRQLAAWLFYRHCITYKNALDWSVTANYMPIRQSIYEDEIYIELYDEASQTPASLDLLNARIANFVGSLSNYYFTSPAFKGSNTCRAQVGGIVQKALMLNSTEADIDAVFTTAYNNSVIAIG